jgi:hypothetical protein
MYNTLRAVEVGYCAQYPILEGKVGISLHFPGIVYSSQLDLINIKNTRNRRLKY